MPTREEIEAAQTPNGGWTRAQLEEWGVPWPPPKGWKRALSQDRSNDAVREALEGATVADLEAVRARRGA